ncbi:MAG TPA: hypothetical protein VJ957_11485 [Longimicrobiales bacterium]|nr:hypothetical protein [Longimicrobiales bacterium]
MTHGRPGVSLLETLIALLITGALLGFVASTLRHQDELVRVQAAHAALARALRVATVVLQGELRWADPVHDVALMAPDSVQVRAVRAFGVVCGWQNGATFVRLRGMRWPDADKDSVALVPGGRVLAVRGATRTPSACTHTAAEAVFRLTLDEPAPRGALLVFERGSYHLSDEAFRYRRGSAGRQPLTDAVLGDARFLAVSGSAPWELAMRAGPAPAAAHVEPADVRVVFANAMPAFSPDTARSP